MVVKRIDWKYALHLPLTDEGFDFSVLCEFRQRLLTHHAEGLGFDRLLQKLQALGLVKARGLQRTDALAVGVDLRFGHRTTAMRNYVNLAVPTMPLLVADKRGAAETKIIALEVVAAVARLNRLELVYETLRCTLNALAHTDAPWLQRNMPQSFIERYGERAEAERLVTEEGTNGQAQARQLAHQAGQDGLWLLARLDEPDSPRTLQALPQVATLRAVWAQQFVVRATESPTATPTRVEFCETVSSGAQTISTPHDPEARYGEKNSVGWVGYKVHVTETVEPYLPRIITDVQTTVAPAPDEQQLGTIQRALEQRELVPAQHVVDTAYVSGKTIATSADHDIEVIGRVQSRASPQAHLAGGITSSQFEMDWEHQVAHCPAGHTSVTVQRRGSDANYSNRLISACLAI